MIFYSRDTGHGIFASDFTAVLQVTKTHDMMLLEMRRFLAYEDMTTEYVVKERKDEALNNYCIITGSKFDNLNAAIEHAYFSYYKRF